MRICCDGKTVGLDFQLLQFGKESRWCVWLRLLRTLTLGTPTQKLSHCLWKLPVNNGKYVKIFAGSGTQPDPFCAEEILFCCFFPPPPFHNSCLRFLDAF